MCELFAVSSSHPATVTYSMREFARHGGLTADHADGWGLAYVEGRDVNVFRDTDAAADSPYLRLVSAGHDVDPVLPRRPRFRAQEVWKVMTIVERFGSALDGWHHEILGNPFPRRPT